MQGLGPAWWHPQTSVTSLPQRIHVSHGGLSPTLQDLLTISLINQLSQKLEKKLSPSTFGSADALEAGKTRVLEDPLQMCLVENKTPDLAFFLILQQRKQNTVNIP